MEKMEGHKERGKIPMLEAKYCSLRWRLVDDLPGVHIYVHACRDCGREYGPEFVVWHASTGRSSDSDPVPVVSAPICSTGHKSGIVARISEHFEAMYNFELVATNA